MIACFIYQSGYCHRPVGGNLLILSIDTDQLVKHMMLRIGAGSIALRKRICMAGARLQAIDAAPLIWPLTLVLIIAMIRPVASYLIFDMNQDPNITVESVFRIQLPSRLAIVAISMHENRHSFEL